MKTEIRSQLLKKFKTLSIDEKSQKSILIETNLQKLLKDETGCWAGFQNLADEPAIRWDLVSDKITWCFPIVQKELLQFKTAVSKYQISILGVKEPLDGEEIPVRKIRGFIIPAIAYDQQGFRLGRGKGFYDRTLANYTGIKIGVCFDMFLCEELPHEKHDIQFQRIVTEKLIYQTGPSEGDSKWS